jgi:hypothetical protein
MLVVQLLHRYATADQASETAFQLGHVVAQLDLDRSRGLEIVKGDFQGTVHCSPQSSDQACSDNADRRLPFAAFRTDGGRPASWPLSGVSVDAKQA